MLDSGILRQDLDATRLMLLSRQVRMDGGGRKAVTAWYKKNIISAHFTLMEPIPSTNCDIYVYVDDGEVARTVRGVMPSTMRSLTTSFRTGGQMSVSHAEQVVFLFHDVLH